MSNMSYCRFENTLGDLQDCYDALREGAELSEEEERAKEWLIQLCSEIHQDFSRRVSVEQR